MQDLKAREQLTQCSLVHALIEQNAEAHEPRERNSPNFLEFLLPRAVPADRCFHLCELDSLGESVGLIAWLRESESKFNRRIAVSLSSCDVKRLIDPRSDDSYGSADKKGAWIRFDFCEPTAVNGLRITSAQKYFPRFLDISSVGDDGSEHRLHSIRDADLNGAGKVVEVRFAETATKSLKIAQGGLNWKGKHHLVIGNFELLSADPRYSPFVFERLLKDHGRDVRRFVEVCSRDYDVGEIHKISTHTNVCTWPIAQSFVQIEIVGGIIVVSKYRLRRGRFLRTWSLRGSNDASLRLDEWTELDHRHEEMKGEFDDPGSFDAAGGPFRYFRLVQEGKNWTDTTSVSLHHIELFGLLISDST